MASQAESLQLPQASRTGRRRDGIESTNLVVTYFESDLEAVKSPC